MLCKSRRKERTQAVVDSLKKDYKHVIDLTPFEEKDMALEGKGAVVFDHRNHQFFINTSQRSCPEVALEMLKQWNSISSEPYRIVFLEAYDWEGRRIYHTDCLLTILHDHVLFCSSAIHD